MPNSSCSGIAKAKKLLFIVELINNKLEYASANTSDTIHDMYKNKYKSVNELVSIHAAKIIKWYLQFKDEYDMLEIKDIKHKHGNVFELKYIGDDLVVDSYLDLDEDGNYPIIINGHSYLISGERNFDDDDDDDE